MFRYRFNGAIMALAVLAPVLGACTEGAYQTTRIEAPPQPGMKKRCFTPPNPGRSAPSPTSCWWYWPKTSSPK